jgi:uncharacterized protein YbaP (TraB family)
MKLITQIKTSIMKNLAYKLILVSLVLLTAFSPEKDKTENALLWEIKGKDLEKPSYLFGTIHLIPEDMYFLPEGTEAALNSVDMLVMELDLDIPMKDQLAMAQKMILPDEKTLADYMTEEDYQRLMVYMLDSLEIKEGKANRYTRIKPLYLTGPLLMEAYDKVETYEVEFSKMAKKANKEFMALESLEFQLSLFESIPLEKQFNEYFEIDFKKDFDALIACYINQDLDCLQSIIDEIDDISLEEDFISKRNENWVPKIENILSEKTAFIAVGAAHLTGERGLITLLRDAGYEVNPI